MSLAYLWMLYMAYTSDVLMPVLNPALALGASLGFLFIGYLSLTRFFLVYVIAPLLGTGLAYLINFYLVSRLAKKASNTQ